MAAMLMAMPEKRSAKSVTFRLEPGLDDALEGFAGRLGWTKTEAINVALDHFMREVKGEDLLRALGAYRARLAGKRSPKK